MSDKGELPTIFSRVSAHTGTPVIATILAGAIILLTAWLIPFERLLISANALTLGIFILIDLELWNVHRKKASQLTYFVARAWVPPLGAALAAALIFSGLVAAA